MDIYFIDVEGGQATLIVAPSGESMLVDAGWPGFGGRDAERIVTAAHAANLKRIDYLVVTRYHSDHVGGVPQLAERASPTTCEKNQKLQFSDELQTEAVAPET